MLKLSVVNFQCVIFNLCVNESIVYTNPNQKLKTGN